MGSKSKKQKAQMSVGGLVLLVVVVLVARLLGVDLGTGSGDSQPAPPVLTSEPSRADPTRRPTTGRTDEPAAVPVIASEDELIRSLVREQRSGVMVTAVGEVVHLLPDDNEGSRHQRFLVELGTGDTLLIAHNIDLAERVPLGEGDVVSIRGQYEWNDRGGVLHWTHHDPKGWREGGWIEHEGLRYE